MPGRLPTVAGAAWSRDVVYMTFLPDFVPAPLMRALLPLERRLEQSSMRHWSAHFVAALDRLPGRG